MFNLHVVQARYGDCLILEYGTSEAPRYILIDGGPQRVYDDDLRPVLQRIAGKGGGLEFVILSHVDDDHIVGVLDLLAEIRQQRDSSSPETIAIGEIWHNTFSQTLGAGIESRFNAFMGAAAPLRGAMRASDRMMRDVAKGDELTRAAGALGISINRQFDPDHLVSFGLTNEPVRRGNLSIWIVAPNRTNLQSLKEEWLEWLEEQEGRVLVRDMEEAERAATRADSSVPNLSSIMFLAVADGKSVLLTGDGRADHLLDGLAQAGLLDSNGRLHVDVLKLPHHGSHNNISKEFLQAVTADRYVVSASGRYSHPSRETLEWIAEVAREQARPVEIVFTNHTSAVDRLLERYDPDEYGYSLTELAEFEHSLVLELGDVEEAGEQITVLETGDVEEAGEQITVLETEGAEEVSTLVEEGQPRQPERRDMSGAIGRWIAKLLEKVKAFFTGSGGDMNTLPKWTFMVYLAGDNNLSDAGETDLQEMAAVGSTDEVNIVAEFDRIGTESHTKRYYVKKGELEELVDLGETDCGDPNVLLRFIRWSAENYPAERYALILWNHGGGWAPSDLDQIATEVKTKDYGRNEGVDRSGSRLGRALFRSTWKGILSLDSPVQRSICIDDGSGHSLDTVELGQVLKLAVDAFGQPIDLMGMDACLMSNFEVAYQAQDYVKCIVASEETEPFDGWPYTAVLQKLVDEPGIATTAFGAHIVDAYIASYANTSKHVTQSALDMSKVDTLAGPLDELANALIAHPPTLEDKMWKAQRKSKSFADEQMWDIAHFCGELEQHTADDAVKQAATKVIGALKTGSGNFVVAQGHQGNDLAHCLGVTIYLKPPKYGSGGISRYYADLDYAADHRWDEMLEAYHAAL